MKKFLSNPEKVALHVMHAKYTARFILSAGLFVAVLIPIVLSSFIGTTNSFVGLISFALIGIFVYALLSLYAKLILHLSKKYLNENQIAEVNRRTYIKHNTDPAKSKIGTIVIVVVLLVLLVVLSAIALRLEEKLGVNSDGTINTSAFETSTLETSETTLSETSALETSTSDASTSNESVVSGTAVE